jgi:hypothetical protein
LSESRSIMPDFGMPGCRLFAHFSLQQYLLAFVISGTTPGTNLCHATKTTDADIVVVKRAQTDAR